ncbi:MAG: hypothetical protein ABIQ01_08330 [Pseudolysinimonas sp.]
MKRFAIVALLLLGVSGCGTPGAGPAQVGLEGRVTAVASSSGERTYILEVSDRGVLPLQVTGDPPPLNVRGVIVEIPEGVVLPDDAAGRFDTLAEWVADSGESVVVVDYLL